MTPTEEHWRAALVEFEGTERKQGTWARVYSEAAGDEAVAKAQYLRVRSTELAVAESKSIPASSVESRDAALNRAEMAGSQDRPSEREPIGTSNSSADACKRCGDIGTMTRKRTWLGFHVSTCTSCQFKATAPLGRKVVTAFWVSIFLFGLAASKQPLFMLVIFVVFPACALFVNWRVKHELGLASLSSLAGGVGIVLALLFLGQLVSNRKSPTVDAIESPAVGATSVSSNRVDSSQASADSALARSDIVSGTRDAPLKVTQPARESSNALSNEASNSANQKTGDVQFNGKRCGWQKLNNSLADFYIDFCKVKSSGRYRLIRVLVEPMETPGSLKSLEVEVAHDCENKLKAISRVTKFDQRMGQGAKTFDVFPEQDWHWESVKENSIEDIIMKAVCWPL